MYRHDLDPIALVFGALFAVLGLAYAVGHWTWFDFRGGWFLAVAAHRARPRRHLQRVTPGPPPGRRPADGRGRRRRADGRHPLIRARSCRCDHSHSFTEGEGVMKPLSLGHVVLNVKSCEESERFYTRRARHPRRVTPHRADAHDVLHPRQPPRLRHHGSRRPTRRPRRPAAPVSHTSRSRSATRSTSCAR